MAYVPKQDISSLDDLPSYPDNAKELPHEFQYDPRVRTLAGHHLRVPFVTSPHRSDQNIHLTASGGRLTPKGQALIDKKINQYGAFYMLIPQRYAEVAEELRDETQAFLNHKFDTPRSFIPLVGGKESRNQVKYTADFWHADGYYKKQWNDSTGTLLYHPKRNILQSSGHFFIRPGNLRLEDSDHYLPFHLPEFLVPTGSNFYTLIGLDNKAVYHRGSRRLPLPGVAEDKMIHNLTVSFYRNALKKF